MHHRKINFHLIQRHPLPATLYVKSHKFCIKVSTRKTVCALVGCKNGIKMGKKILRKCMIVQRVRKYKILSQNNQNSFIFQMKFFFCVKLYLHCDACQLSWYSVYSIIILYVIEESSSNYPRTLFPSRMNPIQNFFSFLPTSPTNFGINNI